MRPKAWSLCTLLLAAAWLVGAPGVSASENKVSFASADRPHTIPLIQTVDLSSAGSWKLVSTSNPTNVTVPATVPGEAHTALLNAGIIGDPLVGTRYLEYRWIDKSLWSFKLDFKVRNAREIPATAQAWLFFDGIDSVANVTFNGKFVGASNSMHHRWVFKAPLPKEDNVLQLDFEPASVYAARQAKAYPYPVPDGFDATTKGDRNRNFIRKAQFSFSWDWGPAFLPCGLHRAARLMIVNDAVELLSLSPSVKKLLDSWQVDVLVETLASNAQKNVLVNLNLGKGIFRGDFNIDVPEGLGYTTVSFKIPLRSVYLWWPHDMGTPTLYALRGTLGSSSYETRMGFRTTRLVREPLLPVGESFYFEINETPFFSKGSNIIPGDVFESRVTEQLIEHLLLSAKEANMNMLRVWGGGVYLPDYFYIRADELGIMVWQEYMFAVALYPVDTPFLKTVAEEVRYQTRRLRKHPSVILFSGNNENQIAIQDGWFPDSEKNPYPYLIDYHILYHETIRNTAIQEAPHHDFISSSPSTGLYTSDPYTLRFGTVESRALFGDDHIYNYKDDALEESSYRSTRFASEYGFQSLPSILAARTAARDGGDLRLESDLWDIRNHHPNGTNEIRAQLQRHFALPPKITTDAPDEQFANYAYLTMLVQGLALRAQTENYRRGRYDERFTMGALYWQLNDVWQGPTWSSIEPSGRWKVAHHEMSRAFESFMVTARRGSKYAETGEALFSLVNELPFEVTGDFFVELWLYSETSSTPSFQTDRTTVTLPSNSRKDFVDFFQDKVEPLLKGVTANEYMIVARFESKSKDGEVRSWKTEFYPTPLRDAKLLDPDLQISIVAKGEIEIVAEHPAPWIWIEADLKCPKNRSKTARYGSHWTSNAEVVLPGKSRSLKSVLVGSEDCSFELTDLKVRNVWDASFRV